MEHISAHWRDILRDFDGKPQNLRGVSPLHSPLRNPLHIFFQREYIKLGKRYNNFDKYLAAGRAVAKRQRRAFDLNMLRQSITLAFCDHHGVLSARSEYVIIGDGYAALGSTIIEAMPTSSVTFINIAPVLEMDKQYFSNAHPDRTALFIEAADLDQMPEHHLSLDIVCMQEINPDVCDRYCELRASRGSYIYSCNRDSKTFSDGTTTRFGDYNWRGATSIVDEPCSWHQHFYAFRPPFRREYDGAISHKLLASAIRSSR
jgi:hypothetical protein